VALPTATGALTSDRIIIKTTAFEVQSLPEARWVNDTTELVQLLLVRSLANTGRFALVTASGGGPAPDYELLIDLQAFQVEVQGDAQVVTVETTLTLLRDTDGSVVASRSFTDTAPAASLISADVVAAFDAAMTRQLQEILRWLVRNSG
jgi:cholesterol transport system auxiliary component